MHELGLLTSVVTAVEKATATTPAAPIEAVGLRVGTMSGALPEALIGSWPIATTGTRLANTRLEIEVIAAQILCTACGLTQEIDEFYALTCPACGVGCGNLIHGREFEVAFVDVATGS